VPQRARGPRTATAANRSLGVLRSVCPAPWSGRLARGNNDCNVVGLGERVTGVGVAEDIVLAFRGGVFAGGRHQQRVDKLATLDRERK